MDHLIVEEKIYNGTFPILDEKNGYKLVRVKIYAKELKSNKKFHCTDGPAIRYEKDAHPDEWWINGKDVTDEIIDWAEEMGIDLNNITTEDEILIQLKWM